MSYFAVAQRLFVKSSLDRRVMAAIAGKEEYSELCGFLLAHFGVVVKSSPNGPENLIVSWQDLRLQHFHPGWLDYEQSLRWIPTVDVHLAAISELNLSGNAIQRLPGELLNLRQLEILLLANNVLTKLPDCSEVDVDILSHMVWPNLRRLDVSHNRLTSIPEFVFSLPNLCHLLVGNNGLKHLPADLWLAPKLAKVVAHCNKITSISVPDSWRRNVSSMDSYSSVPATPPSRDPHQQQDLVFLGTDESLAAEVKSWQSSEGLKTWRQHCNAEREDHPGYLVRSNFILEDQLAVGCEEEDASGSLFGADVMHSPSLSVQQQSQLTLLDLSDNKLPQLPPGLPCLAPRLENLVLAKNLLEDFGSVSSYPASLVQLNLSNNLSSQPIKPTASGSSSPMLQCYCPMSVQSSVSISRQRCRRQTHRSLPVLETLILSDNKLSDIHVLDRTAQITSNGSQQTDTSDSPNNSNNTAVEDREVLFPQLQFLDLQLNCLAAVPIEACFLNKLQRLRLDHNPNISRLPNQLGRLSPKVLYELGLNGLHLSDPPPDIIQQGVRGILSFLAGRLKNSQKYRHMKLMVVGLADQGKSTLLRQLKREAVNQADNLSTVGIDLGTWHCPPPTRGSMKSGAHSSSPVEFSTWDFAGQEDYYATHLCFLSRRSLYLLVWKLTTNLDESIKNMEAWLRNIQVRAPGSTAILVGTHVDKYDGGVEKCRAEILPQLKAHFAVGNITHQDELGYPRIVHITFVSCLNGEGIGGPSGLRSTIFQTVNTLPDHGSRSQSFLLDQEVPSTYIALQERVEKLREQISTENKQPPVLSVAEFRAKVKDIIEDVHELKVAVSFLHDNGVILHYDDLNLHHLYFIDPQWLCKMLAKVVTIREVTGIKEDGILPRSFLPLIFKDSNFPVKYSEDCIQLLGKFEVSLRVDDERFLVPSRLSEDPPPDNFIAYSPWRQGGHRLRRLYILVYMPSGLWPRLITRLMSGDVLITAAQYGLERNWDGQQEKGALEWQPWRTGIQLRLFGAPLVVVREVSGEDLFKDGSVEPSDVSIPDMNTWRRFRMLPGARCIEVLVARLARKEKRPAEMEAPHAVPAERPGSVASASQQMADDSEDEVDYYAKSDGEGEDEGSKELPDGEGVPPVLTREAVNEAQLAAEAKEREDLLDVLPARLLSLVVDTIDCLLSDWYPGIGERGSQLMSGTAYVTRAVLCPLCDEKLLLMNEDNCHNLLGRSPPDAPSIMPTGRNRVRLKHFYHRPPADVQGFLCVYLLEQCILSACANWLCMYCHYHGHGVPIASMAPDALFIDMGGDMLIHGENIKQQSPSVGSGAFGEVYRARLTNPGSCEQELVAMKCFERGTVSQSPAVSIGSVHQATRNYMALRQEVAMLGHLRHDNVLMLRGVTLRPLSMLLAWAPLGSLDNHLGTLHKHFTRVQGLPPTVIIELVKQVSAGLAYTHSAQITYRDLKSANVLVWQFPSVDNLLNALAAGQCDLAFFPVAVKLADFGIGRKASPGGVKGSQGTVGFMAPEIIAFGGMEAYTEQVDIFSFGMFMYEIMSLQHPYPELGRVHVESLIQKEIMPFLTNRVLNQPVSILHLMHQCWHKEATHRPTASELFAAASAPSMLSLVDAVSLPSGGDVMAVCFAPGYEVVTTPPESLHQRASKDRLWLSVMTDGYASRVLVVTYEGTSTGLKLESVLSESSRHIQCIFAVGEDVYLFGRYGTITVMSNVTMKLEHQWNLPMCNVSVVDQMLPPIQVQCVQYVAKEDVFVIVLSNGFLLIYPSSLDKLKACASDYSSPWPKKVRVRSLFSVAALPSPVQSLSVELWCGHTGGLISILDSHTLQEVTQLSLPTADSHLFTVMHMRVQQDMSASCESAACVWMSTYPKAWLFCWDAALRKCIHQVDCCVWVEGSFVHVTGLSSTESHLIVSFSTGQVLLVSSKGRATNCLTLHTSRLFHIQLFPVGDWSPSPLHLSSLSVAAHPKQCGSASQWLPPYMRRQSAQPSQERDRLLLLTIGEELDVPNCCRPKLNGGVNSQHVRTLDSSLWLALWNINYLILPSSQQ